VKGAGIVERWSGDRAQADERVQRLQEIAGNGVLTCAQIVTFARSHGIELQQMKPLLKAAGVQVKDCEQTCISLKCKHFT